MSVSTFARRALLLVAIATIVAGCAVPEESGPTDLNTDKDRDGIPDDEARNLTNVSGNDTSDPMPVTP